jgi:hypothetical protein
MIKDLKFRIWNRLWKSLLRNYEKIALLGQTGIYPSGESPCQEGDSCLTAI